MPSFWGCTNNQQQQDVPPPVLESYEAAGAEPLSVQVSTSHCKWGPRQEGAAEGSAQCTASVSALLVRPPDPANLPLL